MRKRMGIHPTKGWTAWECSNREADGQSTDNARWLEGTESRRDGKHVDVQDYASALFLTQVCLASDETVVYGPVAGSRSQSLDPILLLCVCCADVAIRTSLR